MSKHPGELKFTGEHRLCKQCRLGLKSPCKLNLKPEVTTHRQWWQIEDYQIESCIEYIDDYEMCVKEGSIVEVR